MCTHTEIKRGHNKIFTKLRGTLYKVWKPLTQLIQEQKFNELPSLMFHKSDTYTHWFQA